MWRTKQGSVPDLGRFKQALQSGHLSYLPVPKTIQGL